MQIEIRARIDHHTTMKFHLIYTSSYRHHICPLFISNNNLWDTTMNLYHKIICAVICSQDLLNGFNHHEWLTVHIHQVAAWLYSWDKITSTQTDLYYGWPCKAKGGCKEPIEVHFLRKGQWRQMSQLHSSQDYQGKQHCQVQEQTQI